MQNLDLIQVLIFFASLALLVKSSDYFIDSAEKIGLSFGISPFIVGVTIIAFGTSLPELATSIASVLRDQSEIVVANVVGSNITNILLVLGLTAAVGKRIIIDDDLLDTDMPVLIVGAFFLWFVLRDLEVSYFEASLFLLALVIFLMKSLFMDREDETKKVKASALQYIILIGAGALVALSANWTIGALENISISLQVNPELIALSMIALGTSLPEVVVSIQAARRGKSALAVGNVLGSNIFNTFAVIAIPRFVGRLEIPATMLDFSIPFMIATSVIFLVVILNKKISRWEGLVLIVLYLYYLAELFICS